MNNGELKHYGILGMKWGIRRYQNKDGSLTPAGKKKADKMKEEYTALTGKRLIRKPTPKNDKESKNNSNVSNNTNNIDTAKITKINTKKSIRKISDYELKSMTDRLNAEKNYIEAIKNYKVATAKDISIGRKITKSVMYDMITPAATDVGKQLIKSYMTKFVNDTMKLQNDYKVHTNNKKEKLRSKDMALSNTATPKYYGMFRDAVIRGEIPVCETISMEMNRIDSLIKNPGIWYDDQAVEGFISYCENELTLTDGEDLRLLDSFKLWAEQIFGWYYYVERSVYVPSEDGHGGRYVNKRIKKRLINKQYLIVARGAAKSQYESYIHSFYLNVDTSTTHQVHTAPTMKQAEEVLAPMRTSITRSRGPLFKFLTEGSINNTTGSKANRVKLTSTKKGIENFLTGSLVEIRPMTIDKLQGLNSRINTVDEWLSGDVREDVIGALEQGASKNDDYLIVAVSSEGTVRNGPGDTVKMELMDILKGDYVNPHVSIWWYRLDSIDEVAEPDKWMKANPNIGKTVSYETYQLDVDRAEKAPANRNDILAKRFGIPMEGYTYFFTYEETLKHKKRDFWQMPCALGADLSQGDDFCAFTFLFPLKGNAFGVKTRNYISERTLMKLQPAMRVKYDEFIKEGSLMVMPGTVLDMMAVYDDLDELIIDRGYDVRCFGFDPYNAQAFVERWERENGPFGIEKVIQGAKTESVPLGEIKQMAEDRLLLFDEDLMMYTMGNCIVLEDTNGNRKLYKKRFDQKIDAVAALMDAYVAYKNNREAFE